MTTRSRSAGKREKHVRATHSRVCQCVAGKRGFLRKCNLEFEFTRTWTCLHTRHIECVAGKRTYYVRKKGQHIRDCPFSPHVIKAAPRSTTETATMDRISLTLPYPPSVNHYWQTRVVRRGARYLPQVYVSQDGQRYRAAVTRLLDGVPRFDGRLRVQVLLQPPDRRARDIDNVLKCLLDSLTAAGAWRDDSQVDSLLVVRGDLFDGGRVLVFVELMGRAQS